jgi:hypothetical protein
VRGVSVTALHDHIREVLGPGNGPTREEVRCWLLDSQARGEVTHPAFQVWRLVPEAAEKGPHWHDVMTRVIESVHPSRLALGAWVDLAAEELGDPSFRERLDRRELAAWVNAEVAAGRVDAGGWPLTAYGHVPQEEEEPGWQQVIRDVLLDSYPHTVAEQELHIKARHKGGADDLSREDMAAWLASLAKRRLVDHPEFRRWKAAESLLPEAEVPTEAERMRYRVHVGKVPWVGPGAPARSAPVRESTREERRLAVARASVRMAQHALNNDWTAFDRALTQVNRMHEDWKP